MKKVDLVPEASRFDAYSKPCFQSTRKSFVSSLSMPSIPSPDWYNTVSSFVKNPAKQQNQSPLQVALENVCADPTDPRATRTAYGAICVTTTAMLKGKASYQDAQEIAQDAAADALAKAASGETITPAFVRKIIHARLVNRVVKATRIKRGSGEVYSYGDLPDSVDQTGEAWDDLIEAEEYERLKIHIAELPLQVGRAMTMRFYDQCTFQEVADRLGCSKAHAHNLTQQGIGLLQEAMA